MTPTGERALGGLLGLIIFVGAVMILSPLLNWMLGHGFTWYF